MEARQIEFESLVNAYSADLYRYACWLCHDQVLAEDLVQETFMRAWKSLDSLQDDRAAKSWLLTILRNELARHYKREHQNDVSLDEIDSQHQLGLPAGFGSTEGFVLRRALNALPVDYREPLLLQIIGGFSADEIAAMLRIKAGTVLTRLFRARQKLRQLLEGESGAQINSGSGT